MVATPKIEPQPWVLDLWRSLAAGTVGVARVDLRRPTFPTMEGERNLLFRRHHHAAHPPRGRGRPPDHRDARLQGAAAYLDGPYGLQQPGPSGRAWLGGVGSGGARLKLTRCVQLKAGDETRPLLDFGLGLAVDLDQQELQAVARLKLRDWFAIKLAPHPVLKVAHTWRLPGRSVALRLRYECPLRNLGNFWEPPARLMLRLDNDVGSGVHLSPSGIEFDERHVALGNNAEVRASASLRFPRQLPMDRDDPDAFKLQIHRLSLKTLW